MVVSQYMHLAEGYRHLAALSDDERVSWIRADRYLDLHHGNAVLSLLEDLLT